MGKNELNVFKFGYSPWKYPINWFCNISQFFKNLKYAYQRATRGYCDWDVWDLDRFYAELFYQTLNELAETTISYPMEGYTPEGWKAELHDLAQHFKNTLESTESEISKKAEEAYDKYDKYKSMYLLKPLDIDIEELEEKDPKYKRLRREWFELEKEKANFIRNEKDIAFDKLKEIFYDLWD